MNTDNFAMHMDLRTLLLFFTLLFHSQINFDFPLFFEVILAILHDLGMCAALSVSAWLDACFLAEGGLAIG